MRMPEKPSFRDRVVSTKLVRALGKRAVLTLDAREQKNGGAPRHRPSGAWALEKLRFFELVPAAEIAEVAREARVFTHPKRGMRLLEDDDAMVWFVLEGGAKLCRVGPLGTRLIEAILEPGDAFGRISATGGGSVYELQCLEVTQLVAVPRARFEALLRGHPELAFAVVQHLEDRERRLVRKLESLVFKDVPTRVAEIILDLARSHSGTCTHGFAVDVRITQQDIAELAGASRQMVNRALGTLERGLYVQRIGRTLCILHMDRLQRFVDCGALPGSPGRS